MKSVLGPFLPSIFTVLALAACSSDSEPGPAAPCNDVVHDGSTLTVALASNSPPPPTGGTISEGNYVLTAARLFNVPGTVDITRQLGGSLEIRGDVIEAVTQVDGKLERSTFKYTVASTMLSMAKTCATSSTETHGFIATPTQLQLLTQEPGTPYTLNQVFTKR
jgi:hypothetical protein